jgi:putative ABC transport system permease protein
VVVFNEEAVRRYFGSDDPMGRRVLLDGYERTVVGIVRAMRWRGPESSVGPEAFVPFFQSSHDRAQLLVRTESDAAALAPALQAAVRAAIPTAEPTAPGMTTFLEQRYAGLLAQRKFNMIVLALFGLTGLAVAAIGIYGLMAFLVEQRRREIGVRVALGAPRTGILSMVLGRALRLLLAGLAPGVAAALLLERTVRAFLFNAAPHDPALYGVAAATLLAAGLLAAFGPARRATRVDPVTALRLD